MGGSAQARLGLLVAALLLTSGCLGMSSGEEPTEPVQENQAQVTQRTGGIEGVVTDEAIQAVVGANVTLVETGKTVQTGPDGSYAISRIDPGSYTLHVEHPDYVSTRKDVQVTPNEASAVDFVLAHAQSTSAYQQTLELKGFFECGFEVGWNLTDEAPRPPGPYDARYFYLGWAACALPNSLLGGNATNDRFEHIFQLEPQLTSVVYEMSWDPKNSFSEWMTTRMEVEELDNDGLGTIFRTQGPSPIHVRLGPQVWTELEEGFESQCEDGNDTYCGYDFEGEGYPLQTRVFPAWQCASEDGGGCAAAQQPFTHVISAFYNTEAPQEYRVFED